MDPIRAVLAATDFSDDSRHAVERAAFIAAEHKARLSVLHVVEHDVLTTLRDWLDTDRDLLAAIAAQAEIELGALAQGLARAHAIEPLPLLRVGRPLEELNAAEGTSDLLVLGARGSHPLRELAVGTTADRLLRTATKPLLVVKNAPSASYQRVLVLVDFSASSMAAVRAAIRLAPHASIHLLHTFDLPFEGKLRLAGVSDHEIGNYRGKARTRAVDQFQALLGEVEDRSRWTTQVETGDVRLQFLRTAQEVQPDLIAVGKQGQSRLQDVFLGSVTRSVLAEAHCDVLVVPRGAREPEGDA